MKRTCYRLGMAGLLLWAVWALVVGCTALAGPTETTERLPVVASIAPLADLVRQVGGDYVDVVQMVPLGNNPHTYEPTPGQMQALARARLAVFNGAGLEHWAEDALAAAQNPSLQVLYLAEGLELRNRNPHLWLNPRYMMLFADRVAAALADLDPDHAEAYTRQAEAYRRELLALDAAIREALTGVPTRKVVALHPAWDYFAQEYGLEVVAILEPTPGREPSPAEVAAIVDLMRQEDVRVIIVEKQPTPPVAQVVADETGARVVYLEPLGGPPPYDTYLGLMRANISALVQALEEAGGP